MDDPKIMTGNKKHKLAVIGISNSWIVSEMKKLDWIEVIEMDDMPKPEFQIISADGCKTHKDHAYYRKFEKRRRK